jgi:hypothetical protein
MVSMALKDRFNLYLAGYAHGIFTRKPYTAHMKMSLVSSSSSTTMGESFRNPVSLDIGSPQILCQSAVSSLE